MYTILGVDVGKTWLDVCCYYNEDKKPLYQMFLNNDQGHKELIDYLDQTPLKLIVCEPTGGYETRICEQCYDKGIPVHQVNTYKFSAFCESIDKCKTDKRDAYKLAYYGQERKLKANYSHQVQTERLKRKQQRREDLVASLSNERKRLQHSQVDIDKESIERHIQFLEKYSGLVSSDIFFLLFFPVFSPLLGYHFYMVKINVHRFLIVNTRMKPFVIIFSNVTANSLF